MTEYVNKEKVGIAGKEYNLSVIMT